MRIAFVALACLTNSLAPATAPAARAADVGAPVVWPVVRNSFLKDLNLPEVSQYPGEVLRAVHGGYFPATVAQLAVVSEGKPVQALLVEAVGHAPWRVRTRNVGTLAWDRYIALRQQFLDALVQNAQQQEANANLPELRRIELCTDDGTGSVTFSGGIGSGLYSQLSRCEDAPTVAVETAIIAAVRGAVGAPQP